MSLKYRKPVACDSNRLDRWKLAVTKSFGWTAMGIVVDDGSSSSMVSDATHRLNSSVPAAIFFFRLVSSVLSSIDQ